HNPSVYTEQLTYHVVVTPTINGAPTPTGSVSLSEGNTQLTTVNLPSGQNQVDVPLSTLTVGTATIVAEHSGDAATGPSASASARRSPSSPMSPPARRASAPRPARSTSSSMAATPTRPTAASNRSSPCPAARPSTPSPPLPRAITRSRWTTAATATSAPRPAP